MTIKHAGHFVSAESLPHDHAHHALQSVRGANWHGDVITCADGRVYLKVSLPRLQVWVMAAKFEVRQMQLTAARKLLGRAIGMCPKAKLFRAYIELELSLGAIERVRTLYQKFLEWAPANCAAWCKFADLESSMGELDRARSIFELAVAQPQLDMPEVLWKVRPQPLPYKLPFKADCFSLTYLLHGPCLHIMLSVHSLTKLSGTLKFLQVN